MFQKLRRIMKSIQALIVPEIALTKQNLLAHFVRMADLESRELWEMIAISLDEWRKERCGMIDQDDLAQQISDMRWAGCVPYKDHTAFELLLQFWDEVVENSDVQTMEQLLDYCHVLNRIDGVMPV